MKLWTPPEPEQMKNDSPLEGEKSLKLWAWEWAKALDRDISQAGSLYREIMELSGPIESPQSKLYETALTWSATAYYEYLQGSWPKGRAEQQVKEAAEYLLKAL